MEVRHVRLIVVLVAFLAALLATGPASAKCRPGHLGKGNPAVKEYIEFIPTACGRKATGRGGQTPRLPASIDRRLGNGPNAALLRRVASPAYGAPTKVHSRTSNRPSEQSQKAGRNPLAASFNVVTDGTDARLILLLVFLVGTAVIVGAVAYRRRFGR